LYVSSSGVLPLDQSCAEGFDFSISICAFHDALWAWFFCGDLQCSPSGILLESEWVLLDLLPSSIACWDIVHSVARVVSDEMAGW
jgi:hypothetical protein